MNIITNPYNPEKILAHPQRLKTILHGKKIAYPVTIELDPTDGICNSNCFHCCFQKFGDKPVFIKTKPLFKTLKSVSKNGVKAIELVGGTEPTMHPDISLIIETITGLGLQTGLITNGILLNKVFSVAPKLTFLRISLDAGCPETYHKTHGIDCFDKVIKNIKLLIDKHLDSQKVGLAFLCLPQNSSQEEILSAVKLAVSMKLGYIVFRPAILVRAWDTKYLNLVGQRIALAKENFGRQIKIYSSVSGRWQAARKQKRHHCGSCLTRNLTGIIMADGNVPFCNLHRGCQNSYLGNIYEQSFSDIWQGEKHRALLKTLDISNCPVPCKADDYRKILLTYQKELLSPYPKLPQISPQAHPNFI